MFQKAELTEAVLSQKAFGCCRRFGGSGLVDSLDPELVGFALYQVWYLGLALSSSHLETQKTVVNTQLGGVDWNFTRMSNTRKVKFFIEGRHDYSPAIQTWVCCAIGLF